jgi:exopolysaccharide production protein ExoQ
MTPQTASVLFAFGIMGLFWLGRDRKARTSRALWIPVVWLWIAASRPLSLWLGAASAGSTDISLQTPEQLLDGSPLDRFFFTGLVALGVIVLLVRRDRVRRLLRANAPILLFFFYCGLSTIWSDYSAVSFKRWVKALGDLVMVLIVVTDSDRLAAVKRLLARLTFLLIPVSVLLIKYYPDLGRGYSPFTGEASYTGVTLNKNELGYVCLLFGLGSVWRILEAVCDRQGLRRTGPLIAQGAVLAMVIWLFWKANSMTSFSCFLMAVTLVVATHVRSLGRRSWLVHLLVAAILMVSASALFLNFGSGLVQSMGRDPSLTGRTEIWKLVLGMAHNPWLGTGYDSFWLGKRLEKIWSIYWWHPVQAHDGYIEVFLNLGGVGLTLLGVVLVTGYKNIVDAFRKDSRSNSLRLAYLVVFVAYNFTESAFAMMHPIWIFFLLAAVTVPGGWVPIQRRKGVAPPTVDPLVAPHPEQVCSPFQVGALRSLRKAKLIRLLPFRAVATVALPCLAHLGRAIYADA